MVKKNKSLGNELLTKEKMSHTGSIQSLLHRTEAKLKGVPVQNILMCNPYEKLIPFNLWFHHHQYRVKDSVENQQHMRLRFYGNNILTPIITFDDMYMEHLRGFLDSMTLYQPFYPETFYSIWEIIQKNKLTESIKTSLFIGRENRLGSMEAMMLSSEKNQSDYQSNKYDVWLTGKEMYNMTNGSYHLTKPIIDYLSQAYKLHFLESTIELANSYDFIMIDANHTLDNIMKWTEEEMDLQSIFLYVFTAMKHLNLNGKMIIRLYMLNSPAWPILYDILSDHFREHMFYRPTVSNPFNSEIYLMLNKFTGSKSDNLFYHILQDLYKNKTYLSHYLNHQQTGSESEDLHSQQNKSKSIITKKFESVRGEWLKKLRHILDTFNSQAPKSMSDQWHQSFGLKQIRDTNKNFDQIMQVCKLKSKPGNISIKKLSSNMLLDIPFYQTLLKKRAELNLHKRVMDTKPSQIFTSSKYVSDKRHQMVTWEDLTSQIDVFKNIKYNIRTQCGAEMPTNAWIKMYEMLNQTNILKITPDTSIKTFHLCEAPGAFVSATNHYLNERDINWEWYAQTLKPETRTDIEVLEDHFGLIQSYPDRWLFGSKSDQSGDITHSSVIKSYAKNKLLTDIDLITSDAGLPCQPNELNEQESFLAKINMGQVTCILACLPVGKNALFKTFLPMSEPLTISLMSLVSQLFETVSICKPATSHSYNSEVYIVLENYKGIETDLLEKMYELLEDDAVQSSTMLFDKLDQDFTKSYLTAVTTLIDRQIASLNRNFYYYYHTHEIELVKEEIATHTNIWLKANPVPVLKKKLLDFSSNKKENVKTI
jgi:23S rRNA U2552 (ribose-2'-O)-methylase RlmE/FtsJ